MSKNKKKKKTHEFRCMICQKMNPEHDCNMIPLTPDTSIGVCNTCFQVLDLFIAMKEQQMDIEPLFFYSLYFRASLIHFKRIS